MSGRTPVCDDPEFTVLFLSGAQRVSETDSQPEPERPPCAHGDVMARVRFIDNLFEIA